MRACRRARQKLAEGALHSSSTRNWKKGAPRNPLRGSPRELAPGERVEELAKEHGRART